MTPQRLTASLLALQKEAKAAGIGANTVVSIFLVLAAEEARKFGMTPAGFTNAADLALLHAEEEEALRQAEERGGPRG